MYSLAGTRFDMALPTGTTGYANDLAAWGGGLNPVWLNLGGTWQNIGAPLQNEASGYVKNALADPQFAQLLQQAQTTGFSPTTEQKSVLGMGPGNYDLHGLLALGQESRGGDYGNVDLFDPAMSSAQAYRAKKMGLLDKGTPEWKQAGQFWNAHQPQTDDFGLGDLAMLAAAIYTGGSALGAWGAGAGAGALGADALAGGFAGDILGATGGADLLGMAGAGGTGWITGSEGLGSAIGGGPLSITGSIPGGSQNMQNLWQAAQNGGGATGGNMDWWTELGLSPADVGLDASPWTTNPGMSDLTGGVLNNAGSVASQNILQQLAGKVGPQQAQSLFQRFMGGDASALDVLGAAAPGLLQEYFRQQQSGDLMAIANQARSDRSPFLQYAKDTLAGGPEAFATGAGAGALQGVLAKLSASGGNPMGSPTSLGIATDAALNNWGNDWRQAANIGLGGNYSGLAQNAVMAGGAGSGFGDAAASVFGKQDDLASLLKRLQGSGINLGGMSLT